MLDDGRQTRGEWQPANQSRAQYHAGKDFTDNLGLAEFYADVAEQLRQAYKNEKQDRIEVRSEFDKTGLMMSARHQGCKGTPVFRNREPARANETATRRAAG